MCYTKRLTSKVSKARMTCARIKLTSVMTNATSTRDNRLPIESCNTSISLLQLQVRELAIDSSIEMKINFQHSISLPLTLIIPHVVLPVD